MSSLDGLLAMLLGRWVTSFAGLAIASALVWYLGPLVPALRDPLARAALIVVFVLLWAAVNGILTWRRHRRDRALAAGVIEASPEGPLADGRRDNRAEITEESARLRDRLRQSLALLRKARGRRGYLYEQPWFLMIGPPGAGKTTALTQCGLQFPLAQPDGTGGLSAGSVAGVGGTRLCDWWFADEAVLIDTAGRYTTQDSDHSVDRAGWLAFLDLLRRTRPRQPLNGILVVISLADVGTIPAAERMGHALAIRSRIKEVSDRLKTRLPVYAVFSKADRIAGFTEFFDDLDQQARQQVWGMTFPLSQGVEAFKSEFRLLIDRLDSRLFERLQAERSPDRRVAIASFPLQIASLEAPLTEFLQAAFGDTRLDPAPLLRGVYLTSGTQEGTPIDRLTGMLARTFEVDQKRAPDLRPVVGRAYFIGRTLREVILGEALLVSFDPAAKRRRHVRRLAGFSAVGLVTLGACLLLWRDDSANSAAIQHDQLALDTYRQTLASVPLDPVNDDDLPRILPVLDAAAALPRPGNAPPTSIAALFDLGQGSKVTETGRLAYQHALDQVLLPRLIWRLESQMRDHLDQPVFLYEATRVYLMLGNDGPLDINLVKDWMQLDWSTRYPGAEMQPLRDALSRHLSVMLANPLPSIPLDGALVRMARSVFSRMSPAERAYSRIRPTSSPADVMAWSPASALGSADAASLFVRTSGRPLTDSIPGFFTARGFRDMLLPALAPTAKQISDESWVLGPQTNTAAPAADAQNVPAIERQVIALYAKDYEQRWDAMLNDISLAPFRDHMDTVQKLYVMASPQSPMRDLLVSITQQLQPAHAAAQATAQSGAAKAKPDAQSNQLSGIFTPAAAATPTTLPGHEIDDYYRPLVDFTGPSGQAAPIAGIFHLLNQLQSELAQLPNASSPSGVLQNSQDPAQLLLAEADRQPQPVAHWLHQIAAFGTTTLVNDAHQAAATAFVGMDGPSKLCHAVVDGHYPFNPRARSETPISSFTKLFSPGGVLDSYFKTQLAPYVDTSGSTWHVQGVGGVAPPVTDAQILPFQQASVIRNLYFPSGGQYPSLHFTIKPVSIDPQSKKVVLALGQSDIAWQAEDAQETSITWPQDALDNDSLTFTPPLPTPPLTVQGPWAIFRLFSTARMEHGNGPTHFFATFHAGDRQANFAIETDSAFNPLYWHVLQSFQCPVVQ
ncbi:type VI secretion system membrane subunit TssM [Acidisoma cellulosilytica]|uniref:Type VI secretion system membrane subunit TssM n=1 Tax=Acidisoma cellulosilyticum TaxID=2802395 RepID=A0A963Z1A6_9PROT|nr:type VI secretion system membrane subunit TssM [Acidisoma cellulosilyticum]MCB8881032.1 type VI secretion system membrane subunit TssM [Acidisoma cellulosilyticum]